MLVFNFTAFLWLKVKGTLGGNRELPNVSIAYMYTLLPISKLFEVKIVVLSLSFLA